MKRYLYRNKKTGNILETNVKSDDNNLELVQEIRDGQMKSFEVRHK